METKDFKFTIFRRKKDGMGETVQAISLNSLIDSIKTDSREALVTSFRNTLPYIDRAEGNAAYLRIPRLCAASEYYRNKAGKHVFRAYNGVSIVIIDDLTNSLEVEKAKKAGGDDASDASRHDGRGQPFGGGFHRRYTA